MMTRPVKPYTHEEKRKARIVLGIRDENGVMIPLKDRTVDALIDSLADMRARHADKIASMEGSIEALTKRLRSHRKAKALANKRADKAVAAMRDMLDRFELEDGE